MVGTSKSKNKRFYTLNNVGSAKYTVNFHNGVSTHADGSPFFDLKIFRNQKELNAFVKLLKTGGYEETLGC